MSASFMNRRMLRTATLVAMVVSAAACSDQQITGNEVAPVPITADPSVAGMLRGTIRADGTIYFESLDPSIQVGDNASGAIYGNQNVTAKVTTSQFHVDSNGTTKTWTFKLAVHNLMNFPIGSVDGGFAPYDTVGMYIFFPTAPTVTAPANCGCTISIQNTQGTGNFTAPGQKYYWYHDRLAAKGQPTGQPTDSTRDNPTWTFTAPQSAHVSNFKFFVILSSPWPRGTANGDTTWSVFYDPAVGLLPDSAKPHWKALSIGDVGTASLSASTLTLSARNYTETGWCQFFRSCQHFVEDKFFYRSDNLVNSENAFIEARLALTNSSGNDPIVILALADNVKFVGVGIGRTKIGLAKYNTHSDQWEWTGSTYSMTTSGAHTYRVGKSGDTRATVWVDGVQRLSTTSLPNTFVSSLVSNPSQQLRNLTSFFGITAQYDDAAATVNYVNYAFHATLQP